MLVGLKIDIFTRAGLAENLPALLSLLNRHHIKASFFPALGPDAAPATGLLGRWLGRTSELDVNTKYVFLDIIKQEMYHNL